MSGSHELQVRAVERAVSRLLTKGIEPDALFEGAVKGGAAAMIESGSKRGEVAELLRTMADAFSRIDGKTLRVVQ